MNFFSVVYIVLARTDRQTDGHTDAIRNNICLAHTWRAAN